MKDSELLCNAKFVISSETQCGICRAINIAAGTYDSPQAASLKKWVNRMLGEYAYLEDWLKSNDYLTRLDRDEYGYLTNKTLNKIRATRLAWLDWMIEQCEIAEAKETK